MTTVFGEYVASGDFGEKENDGGNEHGDAIGALTLKKDQNRIRILLRMFEIKGKIILIVNL